MDIQVTSQGGQVNLSSSSLSEIKQFSANKEASEDIDVNINKSYSKEEVANAVEKLNKLLKEENTYAEYSIHEKFGDIMIKIIDQKTKEVIMEYPPKKILDLIAKMCELAGIAIDKKA